MTRLLPQAVPYLSPDAASQVIWAIVHAQGSCIPGFQCSDFTERERRMSPTIFRELGFRFFFFSREEPRIHVHVYCSHGEAKFWIEPNIELADNYGLRGPDLQTARRLIEEHEDEIRDAWQKHFGS